MLREVEPQTATAARRANGRVVVPAVGEPLKRLYRDVLSGA